ncbi:putative dTDP-glucose 4-6-dehydratase [Ascobolus immersus RN42]|uniref:UDP-glucuronic acid decarboxylase 1 n=1 Tax=Ascobolus immersus RN42 TaxID=1160509 RepID=A0A3N4IC85_ASCIM|nr:putative dTDP-glucose 4-6-dehydratase [Ascobolus immersus RN42]
MEGRRVLHIPISSNGRFFSPAPLKKRILVTGGAGFVGSHLIDRLLVKGHSVVCLDNYFTGRKENLRQWQGTASLEIIRHDVVDPILVEVDEIYHLACPASPGHYQSNAIKTLKTSFLGTFNMLGLAKRVKAKLLFSSTSEVYGDPDQHPQVEEYNGNVSCTGIRACYDEGKRCAEALAYSYMRQDKVRISVARIFNTYGPRMRLSDGRIVSNFAAQALAGRGLTIFGSGEATRSFQYIQDLTSGLLRLMESSYSSPVNIGNPQEISVKSFSTLVLQLVDEFGNIERLDFQASVSDDPSRRKPDISKAREQLGWYPMWSLFDGLTETIFYLRT